MRLVSPEGIDLVQASPKGDAARLMTSGRCLESRSRPSSSSLRGVSTHPYRRADAGAIRQWDAEGRRRGSRGPCHLVLAVSLVPG